MKTIKIIGQPVSRDRILAALATKGMTHVNVTELKHYGGKPRSASHRGTAYLVPSEGQVQLECVVPEFFAHELVEALVASFPAPGGDGLKIYVSDTEEISVGVSAERYPARA